MTGCGLRVAEALALAVAVEDFDFDEKILYVRRQLKKLGKEHIFALPKNDRERDVPLPGWAEAALALHVASYAPWACALPWENSPAGSRPVTFCSGGPTVATCGTGHTASRYGSPRWYRPRSSPSLSLMNADGRGAGCSGLAPWLTEHRRNEA